MGSGASTWSADAGFAARYEIESELGRGPLSRVYRARQLSTGQLVAIKLLSPAEGSPSTTDREADRFRRETEIGATLSHTNIVELLDRGETADGRLYAVFAYVAGETLQQALERERQLPVRESLRLMTQVLDALSCAHAQGIVHRDLKPANLMLSGSGARRNALVLDFGLGGVVEGRRRQQWQTLTQSGSFLGTPLYAAPEQLFGQPATPRSDLYTWGLILLECLTGEHPLADGDALLRERVEIPEWLQGHPLGALLETVTAHDASKRDVDAESLIETLEEIARGELPEAPEAPGQRRPPPLSEQGERRHLTVMFCDLVDSTGLAQRLGAECYRPVIQSVQANAAESVERYGGHVVQYLGDGLLVYFGYPQAHEDDAARAVRAAREVLRQVQLLSQRTEAEHGAALSMRVGIHSGPVVVGEIGSGEKKEVLALGETPTIAARLEALAEPDALLISEATRHLVSGLFVTEDLGAPALKGVTEPIRVHRVLRPSGVESRLDRAPRLSPFVGRAQELGLLLDRFEEVQEGRGQAALIGGEAGIGKSRLVLQLRERLRDQPHGWLECRCSPYTQSSALHPVIGMLEQAFGLHAEDDAETKLSKLEGAVSRAGLDLPATVPLFASLLSLRLPERYAPLEISPQLQREKTLAALLAWLLTRGEHQPVVLVVEDLHWVDPSTLEWLGLVIEQCPTAAVFPLLTFRPEFEPPWAGKEHVLPIALHRLKRRDSMELIHGAASGAELGDAVVTQIADHADGIPLFVEELAKDAAETSAAASIPETLQDLLMARLDRLGEAKATAQLGAVLGREFPFALLESVAPMKADDLRDGLARLVGAELLYQRGRPPDATYTFKHALVQDTAYDSLLEGQRRELHGRIADALEAHFADRVDRVPEEIARHCEAAGRTAKAIEHYQRAGERATQHFAHAEAVRHLRKALDLLEGLPPSRERDERELQLRVALGPSLIATTGYGDPELGRGFARARALCQEIGGGPELIRPLIGLSLHTFVRGDARTGAELAEQAVALADESGETFPRLVAHTRLGANLTLMGEPRRAIRHLELALQLHDPVAHRPLEASWGQGIGVAIARLFASDVLWGLGYPDRGRRIREEAVALAREGDPFDLAQLLAYPGLTVTRERARESTEEAIAIARQRGYPFLLAQARLQHGGALGGSEGLEEAEAALAMLEVAGAKVFLPGWSLVPARLMCELGRTDDALDKLDAALALAEETGGVSWIVGFYQLKGETLQHKGFLPEAERCFLRELEITRERGMRSHELSVATGLARLLRDQGRREKARHLLEPLYAWFTEGFDTPLLQDARALLDQL